MELATIARPYAEALFQVAKKDDLQKWSTIMSCLAKIGNETDIQKLAVHPNLKKDQIVEVILSLAHEEESQELRNFIEILVENDRLNLLPEISSQFHVLKNISEGSADAFIISAYPLSDEELQEILQPLEEKRFFRKLNVKVVTVDPSLIGGVIVTVGDEVLDLSVRAKLQKMHQTLVL